MHFIFVILCVSKSLASYETSDEGKYIDLLSDNEKKEFLNKVARRYLAQAQTKDARYETSAEASEENDNQSDFVSKLLEVETVRRQNGGKEKDIIEENSKNLQSFEVQSREESNKYIDLTRKGVRRKRNEKSDTNDYENSQKTEDQTRLHNNNDDQGRTGQKSEENYSNEKKSYKDIQVRGIKRHTRRTSGETTEANVYQKTDVATMYPNEENQPNEKDTNIESPAMDDEFRNMTRSPENSMKGNSETATLKNELSSIENAKKTSDENITVGKIEFTPKNNESNDTNVSYKSTNLHEHTEEGSNVLASSKEVSKNMTENVEKLLAPTIDDSRQTNMVNLDNYSIKPSDFDRSFNKTDSDVQETAENVMILTTEQVWNYNLNSSGNTDPDTLKDVTLNSQDSNNYTSNNQLNLNMNAKTELLSNTTEGNTNTEMKHSVIIRSDDKIKKEIKTDSPNDSDGIITTNVDPMTLKTLEKTNVKPIKAKDIRTSIQRTKQVNKIADSIISALQKEIKFNKEAHQKNGKDFKKVIYDVRNTKVNKNTYNVYSVYEISPNESPFVKRDNVRLIEPRDSGNSRKFRIGNADPSLKRDLYRYPRYNQWNQEPTLNFPHMIRPKNIDTVVDDYWSDENFYGRSGKNKIGRNKKRRLRKDPYDGRHENLPRKKYKLGSNFMFDTKEIYPHSTDHNDLKGHISAVNKIFQENLVGLNEKLNAEKHAYSKENEQKIKRFYKIGSDDTNFTNKTSLKAKKKFDPRILVVTSKSVDLDENETNREGSPMALNVYKTGSEENMDVLTRLRFADADVNEKPYDNQNDPLKIYITVMRDLIEGNSEILHEYDWLESTVNIQAALIKLKDLAEVELQNEDYLHPDDEDLLNYTIFLYFAAKADTKDLSSGDDGNDNRRYLYKKKKYLLPRNKYRGRHIITTKGDLERNWLYRLNSGVDDDFVDELNEFNKFLKDLEDAFYDLHMAIKHISIVTKFHNQRWFSNLKELYLKDAGRKELLEVILHLSANRLLDLIDSKSKRGLKNFSGQENAEVKRSTKEFGFVMTVLKEIKKLDVH